MESDKLTLALVVSVFPSLAVYVPLTLMFSSPVPRFPSVSAPPLLSYTTHTILVFNIDSMMCCLTYKHFNKTL